MYKILQLICYVQTVAIKQVFAVIQDGLGVVIKEQKGQYPKGTVYCGLNTSLSSFFFFFFYKTAVENSR